MGQEARATKDLDAAVRAQAEEIESLLRDALARGWDGFSFRLVSWVPIHDTAAWRGDIKLQFKGQPFSTVQFEAAPAEGDAGRACVEIFRLRDKRPWPPSVTMLPQWPTIYAGERAKTPDFTPAEVEQAAADVDRLIVEIDGAS